MRALLTLPLVGGLIAIDAPLELLGNFQQAVIRQVDPNIVRPLFMWDKFLEGGGNSMLALAFAALAIVFSQSAACSHGTVVEPCAFPQKSPGEPLAAPFQRR